MFTSSIQDLGLSSISIWLGKHQQLLIFLPSVWEVERVKWFKERSVREDGGLVLVDLEQVNHVLLHALTGVSETDFGEEAEGLVR